MKRVHARDAFNSVEAGRGRQRLADRRFMDTYERGTETERRAE